MTKENKILNIFILSGITALVYQVLWQRMLFLTFGADAESTSIIVSIFMLGLGIGALIGGLIIKFKSDILKYFAFIELGIGLFGLSSFYIINLISSMDSPYILTFITFLIPTILMGSTLPLLTHYINTNFKKSIGYSIGNLYFYNTVGAAIGSLLTTFVLLVFFSISQTIMITAMINIIIFILVLLLRREK